jgi:formylglycine-generating enzyme required for sulfatase activity
MGSPADDELAYEDEKPQHVVDIAYDYWIARFAVTRDLFGAFVRLTGYETQAERDGWAWVWQVGEQSWAQVPGASWRRPLGPGSGWEPDDDHPVVQVCWHDAVAFCRWFQHQHAPGDPAGYQFRLPSEAEWEKAARGTDGRRWPWSDTFDAALCSGRESGPQRTAPVGVCSPRGDSVYGVAGMSGNAWEWTSTLWGEDRNVPAFTYPYDPQDGREDLAAGNEVWRVIRGGSFKDDARGVRAACRDIDPPAWSLGNLGFRLVYAPAVPQP